ncbi:F420-0:Gamma-glutamyl ligase [Prochlorococcus sp. MIT 1300]|uniref:F420-0:Gamma-glutamyl ligase n=1 Tax=Prochlorococcus sp. MIT 1300 TaxID=3096218 RepID=UPI002A74CD7F|nr:F420-0:Gamma-glutamyl ligase [Prochlorococcus sp. MIT 1300]
MSPTIVLILALGIGLLLLELYHLLKPSSPLELSAISYELSESNCALEIISWFEIKNLNDTIEIMVPELKVNPVLMGSMDFNDIIIETKTIAHHPDQTSRPDNYWKAYIVKGKKKTQVEIRVLIKDLKENYKTRYFENLWLDIHWTNYGPFGRLNRREGFNIALNRPQRVNSESISFHENNGYSVLPIKTHLLGVFDNPIEVLSYYSENLLKPRDILTIGETPLAIMQGRYKHPEGIKPGLLALIMCRAFHPTSSLATACGFQSLIDLVGPSRVIIAWFLGVVTKLIGLRGGFYVFAGEQARLIDDITGTTPPYDQTIVLGPISSEVFCEEAASILGVDVAIVDVNDLGRVKVIAASENCNRLLLKKALKPNPAGNADQKTPIVLVRPC